MDADLLVRIVHNCLRNHLINEGIDFVNPADEVRFKLAGVNYVSRQNPATQEEARNWSRHYFERFKRTIK